MYKSVFFPNFGFKIGSTSARYQSMFFFIKIQLYPPCNENNPLKRQLGRRLSLKGHGAIPAICWEGQCTGFGFTHETLCLILFLYDFVLLDTSYVSIVIGFFWWFFTPGCHPPPKNGRLCCCFLLLDSCFLFTLQMHWIQSSVEPNDMFACVQTTQLHLLSIQTSLVFAPSLFLYI